MQYGNLVPLKKLVLTAEPSIVSRKPRPQDLFLIFASDGLWEHLSDDKAVHIVRKHPRSGIAKRLVGAALDKVTKKRELKYKDIKKMQKGTRRRYYDDITVIVILINKKGRKTVSSWAAQLPLSIFSPIRNIPFLFNTHN